ISATDPICSAIGNDVLKEGGGAVDAVIATALCTGAINSYASGIGGGAFLIVRPKTGAQDSVFFDCRETAPAAASPEMFLRKGANSEIGGLSVAIPGELWCFKEAHERFGRLPWARLFEGAIRITRQGFAMPKGMSNRLRQNTDAILRDANFSEVYAPNGAVLKEGETCHRTALAQTLEAIAKNGIEAFYKGPIAESHIRTIRDSGGIMTMEDLANFRPTVTKPLIGTYRGRKVIVADAPSAGPIML
ncbi:gamma-glutamyltranspeptidase, partial [Blyttiomyces helicus]